MATMMHFCQVCGNLLYPREDKGRKKLVMVCARCEFKEDAEESLVYKHTLQKTVTSALEAINPDLIHDPTLQTQLDARCEKCEERDPDAPPSGATFMQTPAAMESAEKMSLIFICRNPDCQHKWQG